KLWESSKVGSVVGLNSEGKRKSARSTAGRCVFCGIVERRQPSNIVYEDEDHIAFLDIAPFSEGHLLVCPKKHGETIWEMDESEIGELFMLASRISRAVGDAATEQESITSSRLSASRPWGCCCCTPPTSFGSLLAMPANQSSST